MTNSRSNNGNGEMPKSPFFQPKFPNTVVQNVDVATPRGRHRQKRGVKVPTEGVVVESKSSVLGCTANMMTCIVGSGIVGLPYAMEQTGFVAGIGLILLTAALTEKSLRLLVETAKHLHKQSYEAMAEVAFGSLGFRFILVNMFVMAYGAMVSYLMITQSCATVILGVADPLKQQFVLLIISMVIQFPLACMRDMADLEKTSGLAVAIDCMIVVLVATSSPWIGMQGLTQSNFLELLRTDIIHAQSVFVGLGVLSFAFECQEAAFLVAGSLENPTVARWSMVTKRTLIACFCLAIVMATTGYLGYGDNTKGNILDNLDPLSVQSFVAHGMLGATMFATYPLASFVARHVVVVLVFGGKEAHEGGSDSFILNRADRRILLTLALYILALVPATLTKNMGKVLAIAGVIGGSSLAYIGPGMLFVAVHGAQFLYLIEAFFFVPLEEDGAVSESTSLLRATAVSDRKFDGCFKAVLWYLGGFPLWSYIARVGKVAVIDYAREIAERNIIEPLRIGDVDHAPLEKLVDSLSHSIRSIPGSPHISVANLIRPRSNQDINLVRPGSHPNMKQVDTSTLIAPSTLAAPNTLPVKGGANKKSTKESTKEEFQALEADPQEEPPKWQDFLIAMFYVCFGVIALFAGLLSLSR